MIALVLGGRTVEEWQQIMSADEFTDWQAFYQLMPFGPYRSDLQAAIISSTMANIHAAKGKKYTPRDFLPTFRTQHSPQPALSTDDMIEKLRSFQRT